MLVGIVFENLAEKKWYGNSISKHRWETIEFWSKWLVAFGIFGEVIVAGITAKQEYDFQSHLPENNPVSSVKAEARLVILTDDTSQSFGGVLAQNWWLQCNGAVAKDKAALYLLTGTYEVICPIQGTALNHAMAIIEFKSITEDSWFSNSKHPQTSHMVQQGRL